jgi:PAS domain S-box-containing protein
LLLKNEEKYRTFIESSFDVIFIIDSSGIFRFVSPSWQQHFGYSAAEVIGSPFAPVVHPDDVQPCFTYLQDVLTSGVPSTSPRYRVRCSDGSWKTFIANGSRFIDTDGEVLFHGIGRDISELEQLLEQLQTSEEKFADGFVGKRIQPFWIEDEARKIEGTNFIVDQMFREFAVRDGLLVTGQQQYSGAAAARLVVEALGR